MKGLYLHIPFCKKRCYYCTFYSQTDFTKKEDFLKALSNELAFKRVHYSDFFSEEETYTLYIGGGTPSLFDVRDFEVLLSRFYKLPLRYEEITIELNPDTVTQFKLKALKDLGVNRVSLGVQSFCDNVLDFLGRSHDSKVALKALEWVSKYFKNYSIDLIGGVSPIARDWSLEQSYIEEFMPPHISFYLLSWEEGNRFPNKFEIDEKVQEEDYFSFCSFLNGLGYEHYEVSNFCRDKRYAIHNLLYWTGRDYLAFGPSAVSFLKERKCRIKNVADIDQYLKEPQCCEVESLGESELFLENLFLPLRTSFGLNLKALETAFPKFYARIAFHIENLLKKGYLEKIDERIVIPERYYLIMNEIILWLIREI